MKIISFSTRREGEQVSYGVFSFWRMLISYDGAKPVLRGFGFAVMLPIPVFGTYHSFDTDTVWRGWRFPVVSFTGHFIRGEKKELQGIF